MGVVAHPTEPETRRSRRERSPETRPLPTRRELRERAAGSGSAVSRPPEDAASAPAREGGGSSEPGVLTASVRLPASVYVRRRAVAGAAALALVGLVVAGAIGTTSALSGSDAAAADPVAALLGDTAGNAPTASSLPAPAQSGDADSAAQPVDDAATDAAAAGDICSAPGFAEALSSGSDADVIAAAGGAEPFRAAITTGAAPCIDLHEAGRTWVVVNKLNALDPIDYWPEPQARAEGVERTSGGHMRADVAAALSQLAAAARDEGAGTIGVNSGFRSYDFQVSTYRNYVGQLGQSNADLTSARPGHSEHQTGLAVDVVACDGGCGAIEQFGGTAQSDWVAANAHRFGFIIRYPDGRTDTTGYEYEPWHLRYIGPELAALYADGGYRTLEDFFGMPPAPTYAD
ncbi:D-alanyl-D-alanine carboxypeptidase [Microbacterium sp. TS-1]|nr:D-alanyl-D-alanine carboxypeptidase [Microbacterium sp. TS-1]